MLRSIDDVLKSGVTCPDGDLGKVEHVYFDILTWCVRYLIVDTAAWGYGEKIWVPTCCVRQIDFASNVIKLNHAQQNMLSSSSIDTQTPISHLQEVAIFAHYGYKPYWQQERFRGAPKRPGGRFGPPVADEPDANVRIASKTDLPNATVERYAGLVATRKRSAPGNRIVQQDRFDRPNYFDYAQPRCNQAQPYISGCCSPKPHVQDPAS